MDLFLMPILSCASLLQIQIVLIDKRAVYAPNGTWTGIKGGPYNVSIILKVRGAGKKGPFRKECMHEESW